MCLLIKQPKGSEIDWQLMKHAYQSNRNGMGVAFPVGKGKVHTHRILPTSWDDCAKVLKLYEGRLQKSEMAIHFRLTTQGKTTKDLAHPFRVLDWREDGRDVVLFHNGTMHELPEVDADKSDTWHLAEVVLKPILKTRPELVEDVGFHSMVENVMNGDRGLVVDGKSGELVVLNRNKWHKVAGDVLLSNTYGYSGYDPVKQEVKTYGGWNKISNGVFKYDEGKSGSIAYDWYEDEAWDYGYNGYEKRYYGSGGGGGSGSITRLVDRRGYSLREFSFVDGLDDSEALELVNMMDVEELMEAITEEPKEFLAWLNKVL